MASISGLDPSATTLDSYGRDVLFVDDFQTTAKGDYATVDAFENLRRAVLRRLLVRPGEYKLNPNYGVGVTTYVKRAQTKANLDLLRHAVVDQLSRERRIEKVLSVDVTATFFGNQPGVIIAVRCLAIGRSVEFSPLSFTVSGVA